MKPAKLLLEDGTAFSGMMPYEGKCSGEVVFTTGMVGYVETLTDPSYAGQIVVFTYPLIGNYGVPSEEKWESYKIYARGVILSQLSTSQYHYDAISSFLNWLQKQGVALLTKVDTRALTKYLRSRGSTLGAICKKTFFNPNEVPIAKEASIAQPTKHGSGKKRIIAIDCGMKENILRSLLRFPITIKKVPLEYDFTNEEYDGLFITNGPGNPQMYPQTVSHIAQALKQKKPTFGICLGIQLLSLAIKAKTYKLLYGHRSHNQPCLDLRTNRCYLTSQNHGYAVEENSLPFDWKVTFRNLNDDSIEGIAHHSHPFSAVQFHPEAFPGPNDTDWLFEEFYETL